MLDKEKIVNAYENKKNYLFIHESKSFIKMLTDLSQINEKNGVAGENASTPFFQVNLQLWNKV